MYFYSLSLYCKIIPRVETLQDASGGKPFPISYPKWMV